MACRRSFASVAGALLIVGSLLGGAPAEAARQPRFTAKSPRVMYYPGRWSGGQMVNVQIGKRQVMAVVNDRMGQKLGTVEREILVLGVAARDRQGTPKIDLPLTPRRGMMVSKSHSKGLFYPITDPQRISPLVQRAVNNHLGGSATKTAVSFGVPGVN